MGRKLQLTKDAFKFLVGLDAKQFKQVAAKMLSLMADATPPDSSSLKGYALHRADIGEFRIVYHFDADTVFVTLIAKRNDDEAYKRLSRQ